MFQLCLGLLVRTGDLVVRVRTRVRWSQQLQVSGYLVICDGPRILSPLKAFVSQEAMHYGWTERFVEQFAITGDSQSRIERIRQLNNSVQLTLFNRHGGRVPGQRVGKFVFIFDTFETGAEDCGECQVRVARGVGCTVLNSETVFLIHAVSRNSNKAGEVTCCVVGIHRCLNPGNEPLIRVDPLVRDRRYFRSVPD